MKKRQSSMTSEGIAYARVLESEKPQDERICYDPYARQLMSPLFYWVGRLFAGYEERRGPGVIGFLVARCRYMDDVLQDCLRSGLEQLVILGAGLDSRAYRIAGLRDNLKVFEVDHPATQAVKKIKVKEIFGELPGNVRYVPVDFNEESLDALFQFGYDRRLKTLFLWEGVVYYLNPLAVDETLAFIHQNSPAGSTLVFDYLYSSALTARHKRREVIKMQAVRKFTGEGLTFGIPEGELESFLRKRGFSRMEEMTSADLKQRYFQGVNANRAVSDIYAIARAANE
jgi:methyltransferase (TIGR00027 family)